ncbi:MAG: hypothetical protein R2854_15380 [Caldilineaceae bacterium]
MTPLLFCVVLTAAFLAAADGISGATIPDDVTQLTLFIADSNGNG